MEYISYCKTSFGTIGMIQEGNAITKAFMGGVSGSEECIEQETSLLKNAFVQLEEYFNGERKEFDLPLDPKGTDFQKKVWNALRNIPYGETRSYKQVAAAIGQANASRAVGMANNKNPLIILIPCHRVIGANGSLVGYAGGLDVKQKLLDLEKQ